jgi:hypothetical protein
MHAAVSSHSGAATFYEQPDAGVGSSLSASTSQAESRRTVPMVTIDQIISQMGWDSVDLLKIDTEGWDLHCLRGAHDTLSHGRVSVIQFEYNAPWAEAGSTLRAALTYLHEQGYLVTALRPRGLVDPDYGRLGEFFAYSNFVACLPAARRWFS